MSSPTDSLLRLRNLRDVGKNGRRRVAPPMRPQEDEEFDLTDTSAPMPNIPFPDVDGGIAPESYDVRANEVVNTQQPEEEGILSRLAKGLARQSKKIFPQTQEQMLPEPQPQQMAESPVTPEAAMESPPGIPEQEEGNWLSRFGNAIKENFTPKLAPEFAQKFPDVAQTLPEFQQPMAEAEDAKRQQLMGQIDQGLENPWQVAVYGATDEVSRQPDLQDQVATYTGTNWNDEIAKRTAEAEKVMSDIDKNYADLYKQYNEDEKKMRERIDKGSSTDMDKYYIGMALLMPLIVGGFLGAEAGLNTLAGSTKGLSDIYSRRAKETREDEESIRDLQKIKADLGIKRGGVALDRQKIPSVIKESMPDDANALMVGKKQRTWVDPNSGQQMSGWEIKPGLVALPEYITSKEDLKDMSKAATELGAVKNYTDEVSDLTDDVINIASQIKDQNWLKKAYNNIVSKSIPGALSQLTDDVMYEGRKVNAGQLLEQKLGFLANAYAQAKQLGQLDRAAQAHIERIMLNPTKSLSSSRDVIDQMLETKKLAQTGLIRGAANAGFAPEFLIRDLGERNKATYKKLNRKEEAKVGKEISKRASREG